jgi:hypothetical protein
MTPQEESMLNDLIGRVEQTQLTEKDPEAEQLLNQRLARNPNALYILAQTLLVQKYALDQASAQINQLRAQQTQQLQPQPAHATSFLGSLLGHRDPAPPPPPPAPPPPPGYGAPPPGYGATPPGYGAPPYAQPWGGGPAYGAPPPSGGGSFLRTAATTAAGVAAGALAFEGVESLMHGFGHSAGFGGEGFLGGSAAPGETVINNYYDDAPSSGTEGQHERFDSTGLGDSGNDAANLQEASDDLRDDSDQDDTSLDDASYDDSSFDDSSSGGDDLA